MSSPLVVVVVAVAAAAVVALVGAEPNPLIERARARAFRLRPTCCARPTVARDCSTRVLVFARLRRAPQVEINQ